MREEKELQFEMDPSVNEIFDESSGNSFLALRKARWTANAPFKLEIRKWFVGTDGEEKAGKGVTFITEDGPANLIEALLKHGYGDTRQTLNGIKDREDFPVAVKEIIQEQGIDLDKVEIPTLDDIGAFYDPKDIL